MYSNRKCYTPPSPKKNQANVILSGKKINQQKTPELPSITMANSSNPQVVTQPFTIPGGIIIPDEVRSPFWYLFAHKERRDYWLHWLAVCKKRKNGGTCPDIEKVHMHDEIERVTCLPLHLCTFSIGLCLYNVDSSRGRMTYIGDNLHT